MAEHLVFHPQLTKADALILEGLRQDINEYKQPKVDADITSQDGQPPALRQRAANGKPPKGAYSCTVSFHVRHQKNSVS
jgi:hypothetical protein